jgi:hypothetical protein
MSDKNIPHDDNHLNINNESLINDDKKLQDSINPGDDNDYEDDELDTENAEDIVQKIDLSSEFIKVIDIDDLTPDELLRIVVAVGSKNMAYYLALIVNLENRSRKLLPAHVTKILSSQSINAPSSNPAKTNSIIEKMNQSKNSNNVLKN